MSKTKRRNNRTAGHRYEIEEAEYIARYFPGVVTSRSVNRLRDAQKIDLALQDEGTQGRLPFDIQCKNTCQKLEFQKILSEILPGDGRIKVILYRQTRKSGSRFMEQGRYAILERQGWESLLQHVVAIQHIWMTHPELLEQIQQKLGITLLNVPKQVQQT